MRKHIHSFAWLVLLLSPYALSAETIAPEPASGPPTLTAQYPVDGKPPSMIGKLTVAGAGEVTFLANRTQGRLIINAKGADGATNRPCRERRRSRRHSYIYPLGAGALQDCHTLENLAEL